MNIKSMDDFKEHEGTLINIRDRNYKFSIDGDQCGTYGYWRNKYYTLMTALLPDVNETAGFAIELLLQDGSSYGIYYDLHINVENFEEYKSLVEILGKNLIDKHDDVGSVSNYHSNVCDGELQAAPALFNFHCDKCGCTAEGNNLLVSRFFDARKGPFFIGICGAIAMEYELEEIMEMVF